MFREQLGRMAHLLEEKDSLDLSSKESQTRAAVDPVLLEKSHVITAEVPETEKKLTSL